MDESDYLRRARAAALTSGQMTLVESDDEMNTVAIIIHDDTTQVLSFDFDSNESIEVADFRSPFTSREVMNATTPTPQQSNEEEDDDSMTRTTVCGCTDTEFADSDEESCGEESDGVEVIIQDSIIHRTPSFDHLIDHESSSGGGVVLVERSIDSVIKQPRSLFMRTPLRFIRRR